MGAIVTLAVLLLIFKFNMQIINMQANAICDDHCKLTLKLKARTT